MPFETVHCVGSSAAPPGKVWRAIADFGVGWHPLVAQSVVETKPSGQVLRRFTTYGDDAQMCERLTYISHSDHTMRYELVSGIAGATSYRADIKITPNGRGSTIIWHADIEAPAPRAKEIAAGTQAVFEAGIAALNAPIAKALARPMGAEVSATKPLRINSFPQLGLTVTPQDITSAPILCVFLHGIGGNRSNWDAQLAALGHMGPMVSLDLRGYGDSQLGETQTQVTDYFDDILRVMRYFGARKVILCGLSYGAWIGASFALRYPEHVAGLVLCGGCTGMSEAGPAERDAFQASRAVPLDAGQTPADFAPGVVDVIAGPSASQDVRAALHASMAAIPSDTYRDALNCFCNPPNTLDFSAADFPVLLMTGAHDRLAPEVDIRAVSDRFAAAGAPFVGFEVIAEAGHVCNLEAPEDVTAHLARFIEMFLPEAPPTPKAARKSQKRDRILRAALGEFSKNGYAGASMVAIAKRAGVSKPTLYQYIGQKDDIFRAVLEQGRAAILAPLEVAADKDMVGVLWEFAWAYADYVLHPETLSIARLIIGEAERLPDIALQYHQNGPAQALAGIAAYIEAKRAAGVLRFENSDLAAEHLWSLILSGPRNHALHFPADLPSEAELHRSIQSGLQAFLRAYSVNVAQDLGALDAVSGARPKRRSV